MADLVAEINRILLIFCLIIRITTFTILYHVRSTVVIHKTEQKTDKKCCYFCILPNFDDSFISLVCVLIN